MLVIRVKGGELLKARTHTSVEGFQGGRVEGGRHDPDRVHHLAEGGTVPEQREGHLGVRDLA